MNTVHIHHKLCPPVAPLLEFSEMLVESSRF